MSDTGFTRATAELARTLTFDAIPAASIERAKHCLLDWFGVTLVGGRHEAIEMLRDVVFAERGEGTVTIVGDRRKAAATDAALVNGTAGHMLDFDDVSTFVRGHPTVPVAPAVLALAERDGRSGQDVLTAFVAGLDVSSRLGASHYRQGWHATGTLGTFGAAAGSAHLLGLDQTAWPHALGLAATQAAGLRASIGTMAKPFHPGRAAANGLLAAELAARGFTANPDAVEAPAGFAETQGPEFDPAAGLDFPNAAHGVDDVYFKYYAACYGTHSAIEGARRLRADGLDPEQIESVVLRLPRQMMEVCNVQRPQTALDSKFSVRYVTAVSFLGGDLGESGFTDERATDPEHVGLYEKIEVEMRADEPLDDLLTTPMTVTLRDGRKHEASVVMGIATPDEGLAAEWDLLVAKCRSISEPVIGAARTDRLIELVASLEELADVRELVSLLGA